MEKLSSRRLIQRLNTLSVFRPILDTGVIKALCEYLSADSVNASGRYYEFYSELLKAPSRRVSGNLLTDFTLHWILNMDSLFSKMAIKSFIDEPVYAAARHDLSILRELAFFEPSDCCGDADLKDDDDAISKLSNAAWGASPMMKNRVSSYEKRSAPKGEKLLPLKYGEIELRDSYQSDEAMEGIYSRLLGDADWSVYADDIWNFFAAYGSGDFLRYRVFHFDNGRLEPISYDAMNAPAHKVSLYEGERTRLLSYTMNFLQGSPCGSAVISGAQGTGKTSLVASLLCELPELRLVRTCEAGSILKLLSILEEQPLNFLVFLDDMTREELDQIDAKLFCALYTPPNVLLVMATRVMEAVAPFKISLNAPTLNEFTDFLVELSALSGKQIAYADARNACMDYQVETKRELSYYALDWILEKGLKKA